MKQSYNLPNLNGQLATNVNTKLTDIPLTVNAVITYALSKVSNSTLITCIRNNTSISPYNCRTKAINNTYIHTSEGSNKDKELEYR